MVGEDIAVHEDGNVTGTIHYVKEYKNFSSVVEEQSGHYFPFKLTKSGTVMTIEKNGAAEKDKENITFDSDIILRVDKDDTFTIKVGEETADDEVVTLKFCKANMEEDSLAISMNVLSDRNIVLETSPHKYTQEELSQMTVKDIKALAEDSGIKITKVIKTDVINEFLEGQA